MKASLVSREVVADSIELVARGHLFDGLVVLSGCDKTNPGAAMAVARLDIPSVILYNGTIYPGTYKGEPQDVVSVFEAIGAYNAGKITRPGAVRHRVGRLSRRRRLRRPVHRQHHEHVPRVHGPLPRRAQWHPGRGPGQGRGRASSAASWSWTWCGATSALAASSPGRPSTTPWPAWPPPAAPPTPCCTCWPSPASSTSTSPSTTSTTSPSARRPSATCAPAAATRRQTSIPQAASASSSASCSRRDLMDGRAGTVTGQTLAADRGRGAGDARPGRVPSHRGSHQGHRRPGHPARDARSGRLRHQAGRPRAPSLQRPGACLRLRERLLRGRQGGPDQRRATSSCCATRGPWVGRACRRCSR